MFVVYFLLIFFNDQALHVYIMVVWKRTFIYNTM